jgi:hypothetical protein
LSAGYRYSEAVIFGESKGRGCQMVKNDSNLASADRQCVDGASWSGLCVREKELQRTHTIVTNCAQQAIGVGPFGAHARSDLPPQAIVVRQEILKNSQDGRTGIGLFA